MVAALRARDLHRRAEWVDKDLPALIDTTEHASLLKNLGIDVKALQFGAEPQVVGAESTD